MENTPRRQIAEDIDEPAADSTNAAAITRLEDECEFVVVANKPQHLEPVIAALRIGPRSHIRRIPALAVDINPYEKVEIVLALQDASRELRRASAMESPLFCDLAGTASLRK